MHYHRHRESAYVLVNRSNTLPNIYLELAESISLVQVLLVWPFVYHLAISLDTGMADLV
jgi:hydrogenase-4 membrane subunit HyfE